jgi:hypothetical protein
MIDLLGQGIMLTEANCQVELNMTRMKAWASSVLICVAVASSSFGEGRGPATKGAGQENPAMVTGRVKWGDGREMKERCVVAALDASGKVVAATVAKGDGQFRLRKLPKTRLSVVAVEGAGRISPPVAVDAAGSVRPIELKAYNDSLGGTVRDGAGRGIAGARVTIASPHKGESHGGLLAGVRSTVTNADGVYRFESVEPGDYELTASAGGYGPKEETGIKVEEDADVAGNNVVLEPLPSAK